METAERELYALG